MTMTLPTLLRDLGLGLVIGAACLLVMGSPLMPGAQLRDAAAPLAYNVLQFGIPLVFALRAADAAVARGRPPRWAYGTAVLVVTVGGVWIVGPLLMPLLGSDPNWTLTSDFWLAISVGLFLALGTAGYAQWRSSQRALAQALAADTERLRQAQQGQAAHLLALQARVEPQLLFDTLTRIDTLIPADGDAAEAALDDLIVLLRLLLPRHGAQASTLARELALVAALGRVSGEPALQAGRLHTAVPPTLVSATIAPLLLTELLRAVAPAGLHWSLAAEARKPTRLAVWLQAAPGAAAAAALGLLDTAPLQRRLQAVHGADAHVVVDTTAARITLELPLHHDPSPDR
jgi:hypothetical protein